MDSDKERPDSFMELIRKQELALEAQLDLFRSVESSVTKIGTSLASIASSLGQIHEVAYLSFRSDPSYSLKCEEPSKSHRRML